MELIYKKEETSELDFTHLSQEEQKNLRKKQSFPTQVNESLELNPDNIIPEMILVDSTHKLWHEWRSIEEHVASFLFKRSPGRNCYFLIKNKYDGKNIGIIDVGADFLGLGPRDKYIGWNSEQKKKLNRNIANISICVPTRNFGYNMAGGKLLSLLAISDEVANVWKIRYKDVLAGITVTSLYGRGTQYNRLKYFKYLGKTQGQGSNQITDATYRKIRKAVEDNEGAIPSGRFTKGKNSKMAIVRRGCKYLGIDATKLTTHGLQRGIYWVDRGNTQEFLTEQKDTFISHDGLDIETLTSHWREKWAKRRVDNLKSRGELKTAQRFW